MKSYQPNLLQGDCVNVLSVKNNALILRAGGVGATFLDPPFNQDKDYSVWNDNMAVADYWSWMTEVCRKIYAVTLDGGAIYFMQREKNVEFVIKCLLEAGWLFQNLIIWKKKTSAVPGVKRFGKHYQIIVFATKGKTPRVFHRLRINPPLPNGYKYERANGVYVTDVWDDIRELTSGYFAGDEALRDTDGNRLHKQQTPIQLLLRIILSSTDLRDIVLDPFAGSGTTLVVARQLKRKSIGIEIDKANIALIRRRIANIRKADKISRFYKDYTCTSNLSNIWGNSQKIQQRYVPVLQSDLGETGGCNDPLKNRTLSS